ncbi:metallophosphoesterase [Desulfosporosinus fructosivorans]|uniref:Phosphoesterase n=1 Tax=Desulfosporosinus fructosivorans TaxID=2018669 RepID=A0A4Z0R6R7_9FIRM|nr:metallophosphoesterase family protein [Desulfosporosinus fructosivorans]TGE38752.1 metallophosphoesterase [Desulfosporosinus fructosivorans]
MRVAFISDIHANIVALKAVLKDIEEQQVDRIYCVGDLVGYAPFPNEVIDLIREKNIPTVMGNYDDGIGYQRFICGCDYKNAEAEALGHESIVWTKNHTSEENKEFLRSLPKEIRVTIEGRRLLLVHGSPNRLNEYVTEEISKDYASELITLADTDILICGHTHLPFSMVLKDKLLINVGSVGKPKHGGPQAIYALLSFQRKVTVDFRNISYDYEATASAIEASELPNEFAKIIRTGKF